MNRLEALIGLNLVLDIGSIRLNKLLEFFGSPENILKTSKEELTTVCGIGEKIASKITAIKKEDIDNELFQARKLGLKILTTDDVDYPENLKTIPDAPIVLYVKGQLIKEDSLSIAIVGSRRASFYGLSSAEKFAADLIGAGFTVISGMARGIDTASHRGALKAKGRTIAVMGSGFAHIYPQENMELAQEISRCGAVISELPINTLPLKQNFPRRNRVISGLAKGVLVVEAAWNSGALITADFALEQSREVFAVPGKLDSRTSFGTNALIKQGAKLVTTVDDILEEFGLSPDEKVDQGIASQGSLVQTIKESLGVEETCLYNLVPAQPVLLDEIVQKAKFSAQTVSAVLLKLELKKLIRQLPGKQFIRN